MAALPSFTTGLRRAGIRAPLHAWLLAAVLLAAQALGLAHRVAHAPGLAGAAAAALDRSAAPAQASHDWVAGHDADSAECRLIDQLAHADGLSDAHVALLPATHAAEAPAAVPAAAVQRGPVAAYQARAPPRA